jgi:lipopolysaccharide exporter
VVSLKLGILRGAFSLGSARLVANVLGALSIIVLARLLTPEDFAIVAIASSVLSLVQSCTELSLASALVQRKEVSRSLIDTAWTMSLLRSLGIVLVFLVLGWPLSRIFGNPDLVPVLLVSGLTGAAAGLLNPLITQVTREMRFWPVACTQLAQKALSLGFAIGLALMLHSYWAIIIGNALGAVLASILSYFLVPYLPRFSLRHFREIWSFSGWLFFKQLCETLNWRGDQLIVGAAVPGAQFGIYAMADNLAVIPARETVHPIRQALFPGLANICVDRERLNKAVLRTQSVAAMVIAPAGVLLALLAEPTVKVVLGNQWLAAIPFVKVIALLYTFGCFSIALQPVAMALGKTKILFVQQAAALTVKVPMLIGGLVFGGLIGAAIGRCLAEFLAMLIELIAIRVLTGITVAAQLAAHLTTIFGLVAMSLGVVLLQSQLVQAQVLPLAQLAVSGTAGVAIFLAAVFALWAATGRRAGPVTELLQLFGRRAQALFGAPHGPEENPDVAG